MKYRHRHGERDELYYRLEHRADILPISLRIVIAIVALILIIFFVVKVCEWTGILVRCNICDKYVSASKLNSVDGYILKYCPKCYELCKEFFKPEY